MNKFYLSVGTALVAVFSLAAGCNNDSKQPHAAKQGFEAATALFQPDTLPDNLAPGYVMFRDQNCYISGEFFCVVSIVDNKSADWVEIWTRIEVLDTAGNVLPVKGDSSFIIRAFADAVPPSGATALFCAVPLDLISAGSPADCRLKGAGVRFKEPGPILVAPENGGVRVQLPNPDDPNKVKEVAYNSKTTLENPLPMEVQHPRLVYLIYGMDYKLYFAQMINPEEEQPALKMEQGLPLLGGGKSEVYYSILYEYLPQPLKDLLIGRVDVQAYEAR